MKRKKILIGLFTILLLFSVLFFTSCSDEEANLVSMTLSEDCPTEFVIGCFDVSQYSFILTYKDGSKKELTLTEDMISESDMLKTYRDGEHTLVAEYAGFTCDICVTAKRFAFTNIIMNDVEYIYSGESYCLEVTGSLPEGTTVIYPNGNSFTEVGRYEVKATLVNDYYVTDTKTAYLVIKAAVYDMSNIKFESEEFTYDGYGKSLSVTGDIPKGLTVTYSIGKNDTNVMFDAGTYVVTAHFNAGENYEKIQDKTAILTIHKAQYDMSNVKFNDVTFTYDGKSHSIAVDSKLPTGVSVTYENNNQTQAGKYEVTAIFTGDVTNYETIESKTATMTIEKADMVLNTVYMDNATFTYDKMPHFVDYYGELPVGVSAVRTAYYEVEEDGTIIGEVDSMINVGYYEVRAYFVYTKDDKNNYNSIDPITARAEITKAEIDFITFSDKTFEYDGFAHSIFVDGEIPNGLNMVYVNNAQVDVGNYIVSVSFSFESDSLAERNYNELSSMNATMKIIKSEVGGNIEDFTFEYAGSDKMYTLDVTPWIVDEETYGCVITPKIDGTAIESEKLYESLPSGVSVYFTTKSGNVETQFTGSTDPSSTFLNAVFYADTLENAQFFIEHYNTSTTLSTAKTVTIDGAIKSVYIVASKSILFNITKKQYIPTFVNVKSELESLGSVTVTINVADDLANNPSLAFASGYETTGGIYTNNTQNKIGIFTGYVDIKLSTDALKYYNAFDGLYEFKYAIRNKTTDGDEDTAKILYDPGITSDYTDVYSEDRDVYKIAEPQNVPNGITITYEYSKVLTKPGSAIVKVVIDFTNDTGTNISDGELARYYYKFPSIFAKGKDGKYTAVVVYTVEKKTYVPTFEAEFEYDGEAKLPQPINLPSWITVSYEYDGQVVSLTENQIIIPSDTPYYLVAKLTIISDTMKEYYQVDEDGVGVELIINKGHFTDYKISGLNCKYDGKKHNIIIEGLPEGIDYVTTLGEKDEGVTEVGVYEDVIVYFINNNPYYNDLKNLKLTLTIENNYVEMARLQAYTRTTGSKSIKQFTSLKEILSNYITLDGLNIDWEVHYYKGNEMYDSSYTSRHGSSENSTDFVFSESTGEDDIAICNFTIKLKSGYVFYEDSTMTEFSASLNFTISDTIKVDIGNLSELSHEAEIEVEQSSTLSELISDYVPVILGNNYTISSWSADYYNFTTPYPTSYVKAHVNNETNKVINNEIDYTFRINTWGDRYCLVTYTIETSDDYCFFIDDISYKTYTGTIKCLVNKNVVEIDDTFLQDAVSNNSFKALTFTNFEDYIGELIDTEKVDCELKVFRSGSELEKTNGKYRLEFQDADLYNNLTANIKISLNEGINFIGNDNQEYNYVNYSLVFDNDRNVRVRDLFKLAQKKSDEGIFVFEQYAQPGGQIMSTGLLNDIFNYTDYSFVIEYKDGTTIYGNKEIISSIDKITNEGEDAVVTWTFIPHEGCYILDGLDSDGNAVDEYWDGELFGESEKGLYGLRTKSYQMQFRFTVSPTTLIDTTEISSFASEVITINQYTDIGEDINPVIDDIRDITGDEKLTVTYSGAYYNGTEIISSSANIDDGNGDISIIVSDDTDDGLSYYVLHVKLSIVADSTTGLYGFLFDNHQSTVEYVIRYKVNPMIVFTDDNIKDLEENALFISCKMNTVLQTLINNNITSAYSINSNIEFDSFKDDNSFGSSGVRDLSDPYTIKIIGMHTITLYLKAKEGTCMLDENGKSITEFEITINLTVTGGSIKPLG